jgi:hypothetical protein
MFTVPQQGKRIRLLRAQNPTHRVVTPAQAGPYRCAPLDITTIFKVSYYGVVGYNVAAPRPMRSPVTCDLSWQERR